MNPLTDIVFTATWLLLLVWAIRSMSKGWTSMDTNRPSGMWTTKVTRPMHPEMKDVKPGTELMGVNFQQKTECDVEEYKDLQARIDALRAELEGDDDEEEDDDGDVVVRV